MWTRFLMQHGIVCADSMTFSHFPITRSSGCVGSAMEMSSHSKSDGEVKPKSKSRRLSFCALSVMLKKSAELFISKNGNTVLVTKPTLAAPAKNTIFFIFSDPSTGLPLFRRDTRVARYSLIIIVPVLWPIKITSAFSPWFIVFVNSSIESIIIANIPVGSSSFLLPILPSVENSSFVLIASLVRRS